MKVLVVLLVGSMGPVQETWGPFDPGTASAVAVQLAGRGDVLRVGVQDAPNA